MARITSPMMHGARGHVDGVCFRQINGQTIAASMPSDKGLRKLNAAQRAQTSAFGLAVQCLQYAAGYAQMAYRKDGVRSAYNVAVSNLLAAIKASDTPTDALPSFKTIVSALRAADALSAKGRVVEYGVSYAADGDNLTATITCASAATAYIFYVTDGRFAKIVSGPVTAGVDAVVAVGVGVTAALCVLVVDGEPVTASATECTFVSA